MPRHGAIKHVLSVTGLVRQLEWVYAHWQSIVGQHQPTLNRVKESPKLNAEHKTNAGHHP